MKVPSHASLILNNSSTFSLLVDWDNSFPVVTVMEGAEVSPPSSMKTDKVTGRS